MENRGSDGAVPAFSSQQSLPDGYSKKGASYRRPMDAQPAQAPAPPNTVPSNSAKPVAPSSGANGVSRTSSHRRRHSQHIPPPSSPAAPDVPRAPPPVSYKDPYAPKSSSRGPHRSPSGRHRDPTIYMNASRQQPNITIPAERLQQLRSPPYSPPQSLSGAAEGVARRHSGRRPSVPDRSPLQKLEGKLDDISKEERRARILEMELAAQEKAEAESRARRAREREAAAREEAAHQEAAREVAAKQQRIVSGPVAGPGQAPKHTASTKRHVSMPVQKKSKSPLPDDISESDGGYHYDLSDPWDPSGSGAQPGSHMVPSQSRGQYIPYGSHNRRHSLHHAEGDIGLPPSVKVARGSGSFRDRSGTSRNTDAPSKPAQTFERKPAPVPSGLGLFGVEEPPHASRHAGADVARYDSRRLSKDLPPSPKDTVKNERKRDSRGIIQAQMEMEQQQIDHKNNLNRGDQLRPPHGAPMAPAANRRSVGFTDSTPDVQYAQPEARDQSVGNVFSPAGNPDRRYLAPPMLEEWKNGTVGTLAEDDLDLDTPQRANSTGGNKAWWEESSSSRRRRSGSYAEPSYDGYVDPPTTQTSFNPPLYLKCGPLLRYTGLRRDKSKTGREREIWRGSVMIVTTDEQSSYQKTPTLHLFKQPMDLLPHPPDDVDPENLNPAYIDPLEGQIKVSRTGKTLYAKAIDEIPEDQDISRVEDDTGLFSELRSSLGPQSTGTQKSSRVKKRDGEKLGKFKELPAVRLHAERGVTFWRFNLEVELGSKQARIAYRINRGPAIGFWVPAKGETMNIMFHSCNGFSLSVDSKEFCGPDPMWRDVLNNHQTRPFHVMIGGGDQIYNDAAMRDTTLFKQWTESNNLWQKHRTPFSEELQNELEQFYLDRYSMWFSQGLFGMANSQIPMINIWDDHDIIDGYGSYPHHFMETPVFTGIGAVAFKYYMLFQHQSVPAETRATEPSWVLGAHPGPYIKEQSRSVFMHLGREVAFLGLDCRTERQRDEILTEDSYDNIFDRLEEEIIQGETKHLLVLLGVPIAYPRLNFLENVLTSRLMDPVKALGRMGLLGNFVNKFDGGVEILDDLDDHWTAKHHKDERNWFIHELQHIARTKSVRVTILGGDVHLAAVGVFYSNKKLNIPKDKDHRYMPNVISSAIVNTPPPEIMADIINKRNKVHHLDADTDEGMIPLFTHDVDGKKRNNNHLLQRRNWCSLRAYEPGALPPDTPPESPGPDGPRLARTMSDYTPGNLVRRMSSSGRRKERAPPISYYNNPANTVAHDRQAADEPQSSFSPEPSERPRSRRNSLTSLFKRRASVDIVNPAHSSHSVPAHRPSLVRASTDGQPSFYRRPSILGKKGMKREGEPINLEGGLDICLNLEVSQHDPAGITTPYHLIVPALDYTTPESGEDNQERRKSRISSVFGVFGGKRRRRTIGDDGYSHTEGSEEEDGSEEEPDEEERVRQRYKVGPRIIIPGFTTRKHASSQSQALADHADPHTPTDREPASVRGGPNWTQNRRQSVDIRPSHQPPSSQPSSAWESVAAQRQRHVSAPVPTYDSQTVQTQTAAIPSRSHFSRQPNHNASHSSQLPPRRSQEQAPQEPEPKAYRKSMGGILNQHRGEKFEHEAHVLAPTPSHGRSNRDSYPPHPAIVGAGPESPYSRRDMQARDDTGDDGYFAHGAKNGRDGEAGVGARYLGRGKYADSEEEEEDSLDGRSYRTGDDDDGSVESFVPPKKKKWQIWK
ncbi:hypothetical protein BU23DRAFT_513894 [Bimuria novae-zelandiae CBS 107.79]|uniref:PhoD-like phosphatase domain-containing protein n=1 Tax=Bimuria novae-zelandiae CBS 107.79 TaxID=1447943 RepID=A0A6A5UVM7_9PLEO|nr:hypothetical protein BU23DRAFT_513894 [Bimuria novae-zelandiae CBS 107.79]